MKKVFFALLCSLLCVAPSFGQLQNINVFDPIPPNKGVVGIIFGRDSIKHVIVRYGNFQFSISQRYTPFSGISPTEERADSIVISSKDKLSGATPLEKDIKNDLAKVHDMIDKKRQRAAQAKVSQEEARFHEESFKGFYFDAFGELLSTRTLINAVNDQYAAMMTDDDPPLISNLPSDSVLVSFCPLKSTHGKSSIEAYVFLESGCGVSFEQHGNEVRSIFEAEGCDNINTAEFKPMKIPINSIPNFLKNFAEKGEVVCNTSSSTISH